MQSSATEQVTVEDQILLINALEAEIAQPEAEASDKRWEQARLVSEALAGGMTQQELADQWRKPEWQGGGTYTQVHVSYVKRTWECFYNLSYKPPWNEAYNSPEVRKRERNVTNDAPPLPDGEFNVILADPPWAYDNQIESWGPTSLHYPAMPLEDICEIERLYGPLPFAANAVLFLWVTNPFVRDAFQVIDAWGFEYKTNLVWVKRNLTRPGSGFYVRGRHELLFICTRGAMVPNQTGRSPIGSVLEADVQEHSRKPNEAYDLIESLYPEGTYLELFARKHRSGWTPWGNDRETLLAQSHAVA